MDDLDKITDHLEYLFLIKISNALKQNVIDIAETKMLSQEFLKMEPFADLDDAKQKVTRFSGLHTTMESLKDYMDGFYFEHHKNDVLEAMKVHLQAGNIDEALKVVKG